eukprot:2380540-Prorocentrum_lima.AAC.1
MEAKLCRPSCNSLCGAERGCGGRTSMEEKGQDEHTCPKAGTHSETRRPRRSGPRRYSTTGSDN